MSRVLLRLCAMFQFLVCGEAVVKQPRCGFSMLLQQALPGSRVAATLLQFGCTAVDDGRSRVMVSGNFCEAIGA
jgi:hypothetical protein